MSEKIVSFGVTNEEFQEILQKAKAKNMSISMYCKSIIIQKSEFTKYYKDLIKKVNEFPLNVIFTIRDLFENNIWDEIPKGIKLAIGRQFFSQVNTNIIDNIQIEGYGAAKTMRYSKKNSI
jgi:hypothetical protein